MEIYNLNLCSMLSKYLEDNGVVGPEPTPDCPRSLSYLLENAFRKIAHENNVDRICITGCKSAKPHPAFEYEALEK